MRENRQQLLRLEEELFDTALLGLLELEGQRLMEENRRLSSDPGNDGKVARLRKLEKRARQRQSLWSRWKTAQKVLKPVVVHAAVVFLILSMSTGALLWASADAREILYTLVITQYEQYAQINYHRELGSGRPKEEERKYIAAGAAFIPTYLPEGLEFGPTEETWCSYSVTYHNPQDPSQEIVFQQITSPEQLILQVDTKNADSVRRIPIGQSEALVVVKDSRTQIVWRVDDVFLSVSANHITEAEALAFAYGVEKR